MKVRITSASSFILEPEADSDQALLRLWHVTYESALILDGRTINLSRGGPFLKLEFFEKRKIAEPAEDQEDDQNEE